MSSLEIESERERLRTNDKKTTRGSGSIADDNDVCECHARHHQESLESKPKEKNVYNSSTVAKNAASKY
jgi:hypothetical protein